MPTFSLQTLNAMDRPAFSATLGDIFEHSPWVADAAWDLRPFASLKTLHDAMCGVVFSAPRERQIEFLCGHPELSANAVRGGTLTASSADEQHGAGLGTLSAADEAWLAQQNQRYRDRHGFPFIACVRHYTPTGLFAELASRTERDNELERFEALRQISFISGLRLAQRVTVSPETP